ncbi:hypothetical protein [Fodinicola acaciae]|uniref:hypothetical protein n=1 Tax=Fodinicola acaciae TaxID=2681555 RepID=UPI0013D5D228|nr:hypothetical protein [Fodinicola acaciae]
MSTAGGFLKRPRGAHSDQHRVPRWHQTLATGITDPKVLASFYTKMALNRGKMRLDFLLRMSVSAGVAIAQAALYKYVGAIPTGHGHHLREVFHAVAGQISSWPGGADLVGAVKAASPTLLPAAASTGVSYVGDAYKAKEEARAEQDKLAEPRAQGVDVDTDPHVKIHNLEQQLAGAMQLIDHLAGEVAELKQTRMHPTGWPMSSAPSQVPAGTVASTPQQTAAAGPNYLTPQQAQQAHNALARAKAARQQASGQAGKTNTGTTNNSPSLGTPTGYVGRATPKRPDK